MKTGPQVGVWRLLHDLTPVVAWDDKGAIWRTSPWVVEAPARRRTAKARARLGCGTSKEPRTSEFMRHRRTGKSIDRCLACQPAQA